ncbi:MAG: superoxide dismutase family protein [Actinomycetota bacterium]|nr:superoxide dismutase family protein [Actinomycetota bacterium]
MLRTVAAATLFAVPALALSACAPPGEVPTDTTGTTPAIWTGSPSPSAPPGEHGGGHGGSAASGEVLSTELETADGTTVATADIEFSDGYATVTVQTTESGVLEPGFHGLHVHSVGACEAGSTPPGGGEPGDFLSAGGHLQVPGHSSYPPSGDLPNLFVHEDGSAMLMMTTDAFTADDLTAEDGTALMIHENPSNFGNIPPEKYTQVNGTPGPDQDTLAAGDAGSRVACGVITSG